MTTSSDFRRELEYLGRIFGGHPTKGQLQEIAKKISIRQPATVSELQTIIKEECPGAVCGLFEGVDNSDLRALLALAISATKEGK